MKAYHFQSVNPFEEKEKLGRIFQRKYLLEKRSLSSEIKGVELRDSPTKNVNFFLRKII